MFHFHSRRLSRGSDVDGMFLDSPATFSNPEIDVAPLTDAIFEHSPPSRRSYTDRLSYGARMSYQNADTESERAYNAMMSPRGVTPRGAESSFGSSPTATPTSLKRSSSSGDAYAANAYSSSSATAYSSSAYAYSAGSTEKRARLSSAMAARDLADSMERYEVERHSFGGMAGRAPQMAGTAPQKRSSLKVARELADSFDQE